MSEARIIREHRTIEAMVRLFCRGRHGSRAGLCPDCAELLTYAHRRIDACPHGEDKPSCGVCTIRCYGASSALGSQRAVMRERILAVMRWSGPRMALHHPWMTVMHMLDRYRFGGRAMR
jgi:hypothetical protein